MPVVDDLLPVRCLVMRPTCAHCGDHESTRRLSRCGRWWHLCDQCVEGIISHEVKRRCRVGNIQQSGPGKGNRLPWPWPLGVAKRNLTGEGRTRMAPDLAMLDKMPAPCRRDWSAQSQWRQRR